MGKKVRCIDAKGQAAGHLIEGEVYTVSRDDGGDNYYLAGETYSWLKRRFVDVEEETPSTTETPASDPPVPAPTPNPQDKPFDFDTYNRTLPGRHRR